MNTVCTYTKGPMGRRWCGICPVLVLGVGRMGPVVKRINIYLRWGRGGDCAEAAGRGSAKESEPGLWLVRESGTHRRSRLGGRGCGREDKAMECAALPFFRRRCWSRNTARL